MDESIMKIREEIAKIDEKIKEFQSLQNQLKTHLESLEKSDQSKLKNLENLFAEKLGGAPENDPKKQTVAQKIADLKTECKHKQQELKNDIQAYQDQIEPLLDESAKLTKEMLNQVK